MVLHLIQRSFFPWTNHFVKQALYTIRFIYIYREQFWLMYWKTRRFQTMYALLKCTDVRNETELSLSLRKQRTGEIKRNWNGLRWKLPRRSPARIDCLCYWECLENPPDSFSVDSVSVCLGIFRTTFTRQRLFQRNHCRGGLIKCRSESAAMQSALSANISVLAH